MWIEDVNGDLVNLDNCKTVRASKYFVEAGSVANGIVPPVIFESDDPAECQAYMVELKKELAAFGKLVKVVLSE